MEAEEFKKKWVKALRSDKYSQIEGVMYANNKEKKGYCCLGVGCKVLGFQSKGLLNRGAPTSIGISFPGIPSTDFRELWALNDDLKFTFEEISYFIENGY